MCAICAAEVESLTTILARAAELPKSIEPPAEAWSNIRAAIERDKAAIGGQETNLGSGFSRRPYVLAAAAALLVVLSSAGTAVYMSARSADGNSSRSAANSQMTGATPATLAAFTIEENNYLRNVAVLQDLLDQQ